MDTSTELELTVGLEKLFVAVTLAFYTGVRTFPVDYKVPRRVLGPVPKTLTRLCGRSPQIFSLAVDL